MKRVTTVLALGFYLAIGMRDSAFPQVPSLINYQGRLLNGTNLVNGSVGLTLRLYNQAAGGVLLFEDSNTVAVTDGLYTTFLGDNVTAGSLDTALTNGQVWLETRVNNTTLSPRERVASVPYAQAVRGLFVDENRSVTLNLPTASNRIANSTFTTIGGRV